MDYCKYVNVFQGNGEYELPGIRGIASKWFFLKAGCGNTNPAAVLPFGAMSVSPFSGGYPTGYGNHLVNTHSKPAKFSGGEKLIGFSHLHQSGTGTIGYYYNYAVTTPFYESSAYRRMPSDEYGEPGYYSCRLEDILCELTVTKRTAFHRYTFGKSGGMVKIDFSNNGLILPDSGKDTVENLHVSQTDGFSALACADIAGIKVFFAVSADIPLQCDGSSCIFKLLDKKEINVRLSISIRSEEKAAGFLSEGKCFDDVRASARELWNDALSKISVRADEKTKEIFYSNMYHSLIKPSDRYGESFIYDGDKPFFTDFATLWDMYKTALPLIFMLYPEEGRNICETLLCTGEALGNIPNSLGLCDRYKLHSTQARMLGDYVLLTAYRYGVITDAERLLRVIRSDVFAPDKEDFIKEHKCSSYTFFLDMADGCALAAELARETGNTALAAELEEPASLWKSAFDESTGLLKEDSEYYEGTLYNYSFRQMVKMDERIALCGGNEKFVALLDKFFGYGAPDVVLNTDPSDYDPVRAGFGLGRFEGFNNESDTEAPYSYVYAGRQDRTCEIIRAGMKCMFTTGKGGLPGNNDSGALSSYYVMAVLGIFPVAGQDLFLLGSPAVDGAELKLFNGNVLTVEAENNSDVNIYVKDVFFNGRPVTDFRLRASELLKGGTLKFIMTGENRYE